MNYTRGIHTADGHLLDKAIDAFYRQTGLHLHIYANEIAMGGRIIDAIIGVEGYEALRFNAEIKKWVQQKNIGVIQEQIKRLPGIGMLVADYVNPNMADKMRDMEIPFIDTVGNAYINEKPLYVFVKGNKQENKVKSEPTGRAFKPTGLKVIHALLIKPELINAAYREIKNVASVAIGTIGGVFRDLKEAGFMVEQHNGMRQLVDKKRLLDRWVEAYLEMLRPKQLVGRFTTDDQHWWEYVDLTIYGAKWGGEVAAAKMTNYLRPEKLTIYLPKKGGRELLRDVRFRKDDFGEVVVYQAFWNENGYLGYRDDLVDPLIVYADLLATADARNIEIAQMIYGNEIARLIDRS